MTYYIDHKFYQFVSDFVKYYSMIYYFSKKFSAVPDYCCTSKPESS